MSIDKETGLTDKQMAFCEHYIACGFNGAEAARQAGYKAKSSSVFTSIANENLTKPDIQRYLKKLSEPSKEKRIASAEEVLQGLTDMFNGVPDANDPDRKSIPSAVRVKAGELLLRVHGAFNDKLTVKSDGPIVLAGDDYVPD